MIQISVPSKMCIVYSEKKEEVIERKRGQRQRVKQKREERLRATNMHEEGVRERENR